jgi:3-dehydroquinate synthase
MRGIDFINIPTTLDAQIDASIGGKTGINFAEIKNLIGTFNQPKAVIIDIQTLNTLPKRVFISSFAEIIKHGLIADKNYFEIVTSKHPNDFSKQEIMEIIIRSCEIKKEIVQNDETEQGQRKLVNFGHTIGHAVEAVSLETAQPLLHGEAISIGMVAEATLSKFLGYLTEKEIHVIKEALQKIGLPVKIKDLDKKAIFEKMRSDKKNEKGKIAFTLLEKFGKGIFNQYVEEELIEKALEEILE